MDDNDDSPRILVHVDHADYSWTEILGKHNHKNDSWQGHQRLVEAYCIHVEPKQCSRILKQLAQTHPLERQGLSHLKRVRRRQERQRQEESNAKATRVAMEGDESSSTANHKSNKRSKTMPILEVLIGLVEETPSSSSSSSPSLLSFSPPGDPSSWLLQQHHLHVVTVPGRPPQSEVEYQEFNAVWPTHHLPLSTLEYAQKQLQFADPTKEWSAMNYYLEQALQKQCVLIVDPSSLESSPSSSSSSVSAESSLVGVVSDSQTEEILQQRDGSGSSTTVHTSNNKNNKRNPLATPILLAIQGVSRRERQMELSPSSSSSSPSLPQSPPRYICTGYDVYSYYEPSVFEAMACLHSRIRRLIYYSADDENSNDGGSSSSSRSIPDHDKESMNHSSSSSSSTSSPSCSSAINGATNRQVWHHGCSKHSIHNLPGTNHRYRVFVYRHKR